MWNLVLLLIVICVIALLIVVYTQPRWAMRWVAWMFPSVLWFVETQENKVALTIDDVPGPAIADILSVLDRSNAHATFFVIGSFAEKNPSVVKQILRSGHEIGHHMYFDTASWKQTAEEFERDFVRTEQVLKRILEEEGSPHMLNKFRPASGFFHSAMLRFVESRGYRVCLGSVYPFDPQVPSSTINAWHVCSFVERGSLVILHDRTWTVLVLERFLDHLHSLGWQCCSVAELLGLKER